MPTCDLVHMVHNKMIGMYKAITDDLIYLFMKIANYILWMKRESSGKDLDSTSLKLKVAKTIEIPRFSHMQMTFFNFFNFFGVGGGGGI
jgi:hypothetical protein